MKKILSNAFRLDFFPVSRYNSPNFIGQFATILSVNKTRDFLRMGILCPFFLWVRGVCAHFLYLEVNFMRKNIRTLSHAAIIAALYVVLTHMQNILLPNSASFAIQMRLSEALCVLAFFTPAAIYGLSAGCLIFNLTFAGALPTDWFVGSLATLLAAWAMFRLRSIKVGKLPLPGLLMPAVTNGVLVGWELTVYIGQGFWLNAVCVAIGELAVLLIFGSALYLDMNKRHLDTRLFGAI